MAHKKQKKRARARHRYVLAAAILVVLLAGAGGGFVAWRAYHQHTHLATRHKAAGGDTDEPLHPASSAKAATTPLAAAAPAASAHDYAIPPVANGAAPVLSRIPTKEPVVFLGIDDGANKQPFELQLMQDNGVVASLFLANRFIKDNPSFFADFVDEGSLIEDHTLDHKLLSQLSYNDQVQEICGMADLEEHEFSRRPILFRPPGGDYNNDTARAAATCGMRAVVLWDAKANGGSMQYQNGGRLHAGDIVLMHFRPEFKSDMQAFLGAEKAAGLHTELLEDWLQ